MDVGFIKQKAAVLFGKYKFVLLILIAGVVLMLLPTGQKSNSASTYQTEQKTEDTQQLCAQLEELLTMVKGAGQVKVLLTVAQGLQTVYQADTNGTSVDTVTVTDENRNETGLVQQINGPKYQGAIVLCQGADDPQVRLDITEAVSKITGLGANQIAVLKMN